MRFIERNREELGVSPSYIEMAEFQGVRQNMIEERITALETRGLLIRTWGVHRSVRLTAQGRAALVA